MNTDISEKSILSEILIDPSGKRSIYYMNNLNSYFFKKKAAKEVFVSLVNLRKVGIEINLLTVADELKNRGCFDYIGGASYLAGLIESSELWHFKPV